MNVDIELLETKKAQFFVWFFILKLKKSNSKEVRTLVSRKTQRIHIAGMLTSCTIELDLIFSLGSLIRGV